MLKKLFGRVGLYGLAPHVPKIASIFILPIITKHLTSTDYGIYGLVMAYTAALSSFQVLGLNMVLSNSFYKSPIQYKWLWRQIHGFLNLWTIAFSFILATVLYFLIPTEAIANRLEIIILVCIPIALFKATETIVFRYFHLSFKAVPLAVRTVFIGFLTVFLNWYTIAILKMGYMGWFWSTFITSIVSFFIYFYAIYFKYNLIPIFNFKIKTIRKALIISLPTVPHFYSGYLLNTSSRVVMDVAKMDIGSIGLYNLASNFGNYFAMFGEAIGMAVSPMYLQLYKKAENIENREKALFQARTITFVLQLFVLVVSFLVCIWLKEIFQFLIRNEELRRSYPLAIVLIMGYCYRPMYLGVISKYFYFEKTKILWKISFVAGVLNVLLNILFIPLYGIYAAAIIAFISFMYMGYSGYFINRFNIEKDYNYHPLLWLMINILLALLSFFIADINITFKVIVTVGVLGILFLFVIRNKAYLNKLNPM